MKKLFHILYGFCLVATMMAFSACEDDYWNAYREEEELGTGEPVNILLGINVPESEKVVSTRSLDLKEQHEVSDFYLLIFSNVDNSNDIGNWKVIFSKYYTAEDLESGKENYDRGVWNSVVNGNVNSTHGVVMAKARDAACLIYGIANVKGGEVNGESLLGVLQAFDANAANRKTVDELYNLQIGLSLPENSILERNKVSLLMSGVFEENAQIKNPNYAKRYTKGTAGLVNINSLNIRKDNQGNVDLTKTGVINLRRLSSHITFKIRINDEVFSDFRMESWKVVHVPKYSYLMDQGDNQNLIRDDASSSTSFFVSTDEQVGKTIADQSYQFDFYMMENRKNARDISTLSNDPVPAEWATLKADANFADYNTSLTSYYQPQYGKRINTTTGASKRTTGIYKDLGDDAFKSAKRELELKDELGHFIDNADGSKQFVYVEPNATYVVFKGRLLFQNDSENTQLHDLINESTSEQNNYADVTYVVHLGYARTKNLSGSNQDIFEDFNSLRNTDYTYNITIAGVNSIFTHVIAESDDIAGDRESSKLQPGASGVINTSSQKMFNCDSHFHTFIAFLDKKSLTTDGETPFRFTINTPWSDFDSNDITIQMKDDPDFNWIKVRLCYDQRGSSRYIETIDGITPREPMYYKVNVPDNYGITTDEEKARYNDNYSGNNFRLMDLYDLKQWITDFGDGSVTPTVLKDSGVKQNLKWSDLGEDEGLFFTFFLDEYYYHKPPSNVSWQKPYWHEFVNEVDRTVKIESGSNLRTTRDGESGMTSSSLFISQRSIQTYYTDNRSVYEGVNDAALGVEHINETRNPRWYGDSLSVELNGEKYSYENGWKNSVDFISGTTHLIRTARPKAPWKYYVDKRVDPKYNNLAMRLDPRESVTNPKFTDPYLERTDELNPYKANAVRLCMSRNRDENGNGYIDEDELKWYLPASHQMDVINLCRYSLETPLIKIINFNDYIVEYDTRSSNSQHVEYILPPELRPGGVGGAFSTVQYNYDTKYGKYMTTYSYLCSDKQRLGAHEMVNLNQYDNGNANTPYMHRSSEMRCVRFLGIDSYKDGNDIGYDNGSGSVDWTEDHILPPIYKYHESERVFEMKYLDHRSTREGIYRTFEELDDHSSFSPTNRPYLAFKVATDLASIEKNGITQYYLDKNQAVKPLLEYSNQSSPCRTYVEATNSTDVNDRTAWRIPNQMELAIIMLYLRDQDQNHLAKDNGNNLMPYYGENPNIPNKDIRYFSKTTWDFTPRGPKSTVWGRVSCIRWDSGQWKMTSTEVAFESNSGTTMQNVKWSNTKSTADMIIRCVKDWDL